MTTAQEKQSQPVAGQPAASRPAADRPGAAALPLAGLLLLGVVLVVLLSRGQAIGAAIGRNLGNRAFLVAAMRPEGQTAATDPDLPLPANAFQARARARLALREGRTADAEHWLAAGLVGVDPDGLTRFETCRLLIAQTRAAEARMLCRDLPATAAYWLAQGIIADEAGRADEAIVYFDLARVADPDLLTAWERLGRVYYGRQRLEEAIAVYEHLLTTQTWLAAETYHQLGAAYTSLGRLDEARAVLELGLSHYPSRREFHLALADTARAADDLAAADTWYARLLAQQPGDAYAWAQRGEVALQRGRAREAADYLERATVIEPTAAGYWLSLAGAADAANDIARATLAYDQALVLRPSDVGVQLAAVRFFARTGQPGKARAGYERILALAPGGSEAAEALAALDTGQAAP